MAYNRFLRRGHLITPYGVGAIVPFPNDESLIIAGIDGWKNGEDGDRKKYIIEDKRLAKRLKVNELRFPPEYIENVGSGFASENVNKYIDAYRFPQWFYCPICGHMEYYSLQHEDFKDIICDHKKSPTPEKYAHKKEWRMVPERFVVVCPEGHLMDFPIIEFLHDGTPYEKQTYNYKNYTITRYSGGESAALSGISYKCTETEQERNLGGITQDGALSNIRLRNSQDGCCPGYRPWLGEDMNEKCNVKIADLKVVQRGGTNVWFPEQKSSIYIPENMKSDADRRILEVAESIYPTIVKNISNGQIDDSLIAAFADVQKVDEKKLIECIHSMYEGGINTGEEIDDEDSYRKYEYDAISKSVGSDKHELYVINRPISDYNGLIHSFFKSISLVYKMKETRALIGFSRLYPQTNKTIEDFKKQLTKDGTTTWIPAVQVNGEGLFIEFDSNEVKKWKEKEKIKARAEIMKKNFNSSAFRSSAKMINLNPEYILLHTFAHILINELGKKCGYGTSSLRERLYVSREKETDMLGILIYTSSGSSEGSLGGLVREGLPGRLEDSILNALREAEWCSADPFCISSLGQGTGSCNLAACHNCALLPETCCEVGNKLLDRAVLVGVLDDREIGYFSNLLKKH